MARRRRTHGPRALGKACYGVGMTQDLSHFPITRKWPAQHPDRLQLYSLPTPNGVKVSIALEETGLPYEAHRVDFEQQGPALARVPVAQPEQQDPGHPRSRTGPAGSRWRCSSPAPSCCTWPTRPASCCRATRRCATQAVQWLMFQMGGVGPMFGQLGFFHKFAGKDYEDKRPRDRYVAESKRLLEVLDRHLAGRAWMMGDEYSIADIATFPWVRNLVGFYDAGDLVEFARFTHVRRALDAFLARPAVQRGLTIPAPRA